MFLKCWVRSAVVCAVGGACALASGGRDNPPPAPPPREKPADDAWLPKPGSDPKAGDGGKERVAPGGPPISPAPRELGLAPPSAFPDLVIPEAALKSPLTRWPAFEKLCPRLFGAFVLKIEPTDDTLRKLLKARLHQGTLEFQQTHKRREGGVDPGPLQYALCLLDLQVTATELWAKEPKELVPWLEELVIAAKELEWKTRSRVEHGAVGLWDLHLVTRCRLKMESELWKAKNPK